MSDCGLCGDSVEYWARPSCACEECNYCSICSLKLRVIMNDFSCPFCKTKSPLMVYSKNKFLPFSAYSNNMNKNIPPPGFSQNILAFDAELQSSSTIMHLNYLKEVKSFNCKEKTCSFRAKSLETLKDHLEGSHALYLCDLCAEHRKVFVSELELFNKVELISHYDKGVKGSGFSGHPLCEFCSIRFFDDMQLFKHMKDKHFSCGICDQQGEHLKYNYYKNYETLEVHFRKAHFMCENEDCRLLRFIVYKDEISLRVHNANMHNLKNQQFPVEILVQPIPVIMESRNVETSFDLAEDFPSLSVNKNKGGGVRFGGSAYRESIGSKSSRISNDDSNYPALHSEKKSQIEPKKKKSEAKKINNNKPQNFFSEKKVETAYERAKLEERETKSFGRKGLNNVYEPPPTYNSAISNNTINVISRPDPIVVVSKLSKVRSFVDDFPSLPAPIPSISSSTSKGKTDPLKCKVPLGSVVIRLPEKKKKNKNELRDLAMIRK